MKRAKEALMAAIAILVCLIFCGKPAADLYIHYDDQRSDAYKRLINELTVEAQRMVMATDCSSCDEKIGKISVRVRKEIIFIIFKDKHGREILVSSAGLSELSGAKEISQFAVKSVRCLYLFYQLSARSD